MALAHGVFAGIGAPFDSVLEALLESPGVSGIYYEILPVKPRKGVAIGEKHFFHARNSLETTKLLLEARDATYVKVVATSAGNGLLDFFGLGSSRDYALSTVLGMAERLSVGYKVLAEAERLEASSAVLLWGLDSLEHHYCNG